MANEINFDFAGAEAAGISRQDIVREIEKSGKVKFDFAGARKAGISDDEIYAELSSRAPQQAEEDIVAGPPEDEDLPEGDVFLGEMTAEEVPTNPNTIPINTSSDQKTTEPSAPMFNQEGELTTGIASQMEANREQVMEQGQEQANVEGFANVVDPITGEKKQLTEGGITPDYPMLVGTKLGLFGGPGMMGEAALKTLATSEIPRGIEIAKGAFDNLIARGGLFKEFAETKGTLSKEAAYIIARHPNMTEDEMVQALTGVKTADQAYALSRMLGEPGYIKQAVRHEGDAASGMLRADLESGKEHIVNVIGEVDVARAKAQYGDMVDTIAKDYTSVHNATPMLEDLDFLERFYGVTPSVGNRVVTQMKATLGQNPNINLSDALEFRADLNHLINKATRGREKVKLNAIKDNLDGFINSVATPEQKQIIDEAISNYSRTMQNRDVLDLVTKNTDDRGIAVNWTKLHRDLNDANLRSPEAIDALRIAEAFSKRFGNDQQLLQAALPKGSSPDAGGVLGAWGYIVNHLKDALALYGNRAENLKIQKAIMKSLKRGTTNLDFVNAMKADKDIPEDVIKIFEPLQIPYKAGARQTGDVNLEPIVTPVGGRDMTQPTKVANDVIPPLSENQALQQSLDEIPTKPSNATEREVLYSPQNKESGVQVANEIYRQGSHLAERRIEELLGYGDRTPAETAELRTLQDHMIEAGTGHKDNIARATDLPEDARITNGDDGYYYIELPPYNGTNVLGQSGRTPSEVRRLAEGTFGRFNIPLASNAEIKAASEGSTNIVDPGDIESFRLYQDMPRNTRVEEAISQLEQGESITINDKTFDKFHLYLNDDGEASISQPLLDAIRNSKATMVIANTEAKVLSRAEESFNTLVRDIRRIERTPANQRTVQQSAQLSELRRERLLASREVERLRNTTPNSTRFFNSFRSGNHNIEVTDRGNGGFTLNFNGKRVPISIRNSGAVTINTQDFTQGSGQGAQFYAEFYKALSAAGLKHNISGLTSVNTMRLPINIYKHKLDNGTLPIVGGQGKLQSLMQNAVNKINHIAGTDIRHMTDNQLEHLAQTTGSMRDVNAGINSLKLYRKAARLLGEGRALSVVALAPLINAAYEENED